MATTPRQRVGIVGGTGPHGRGLALRFARGGHDVIVGSRDAARAQQTVTAIGERLASGRDDSFGQVTAAANQVAATAEVVVIAVPFDGLDPLLDVLAGDLNVDHRLIVSCVNPLSFGPRGVEVMPVDEGSAAERIAARCPQARVTAAFHHISAVTLWEEDDLHREHVLVAGDDADARDTVVELAGSVAALGGVDAGPLRNAGILEAMTAVLIGINRHYQARSGLIIAGLPERSSGR